MANDLVAKLKMDSKEWDTSINKSKRQIKDFNSSISELATTGAKFFGGMLAGAATLETFNKIIGSTQTTGDAFEKTMQKSKSAIDLFFTSIAKGDFSNFINGLTNSIEKAGQLADKQDELATKKLFTNKELNELMLQKKIQDNIAKDRTKSEAERNAALEKSRNIQKDINQLSKNLAVTERENAYALLNSAIADQGFKGKVSDSMWESVTRESNRGTVQAGADDLARRQAEIKKETKTVIVGGGGAGGGTVTKVLTERGKQLQKEYDKWLRTREGQTKLFYKNFLEMDDGEESKFAKAVQHLNNSNNLYGNISDSEFELNRIDSRINGGYNGNNKPVAAPTKSGSIANDKKMLGELRKQFENETDEGIRKTLRNQIYFLDLEVRYKETGKQEDAIEMLEIDDVTTEDLGLKFVEPQKLIETNTDDLDYLNSMSTLMGSIAGATGQASDSWLSYTSNVISGIGTMLPLLASVFKIKGMEAIADQAKLPFPLNIVAMGATAASLASTIASLPKFESGGIVPGNNFSGDKVLSRLNSGEMILNKVQQGNLFNMLNSNSVGGAGVSNNKVELQVSGKNLVAVLNNYNNKHSRI